MFCRFSGVANRNTVCGDKDRDMLDALETLGMAKSAGPLFCYFGPD